jgi:hypothetical protein
MNLTFNLILDGSVEDVIQAQEELLADHPSLSEHVALIVGTSEVERGLES